MNMNKCTVFKVVCIFICFTFDGTKWLREILVLVQRDSLPIVLLRNMSGWSNNDDIKALRLVLNLKVSSST